MSLQVAVEDMNLNIKRNIVRSYGVYFNLDEFDHPYQLKKKRTEKVQISKTLLVRTFKYA